MAAVEPTEAMLARAQQALAVALQRSLGAGLIDTADPAAGVSFQVGELADDGNGGLHAAALSAMIELAGYLAVLPTLAEPEHAVTHVVSTQMIARAPGRAGGRPGNP